MIGVEMSEETHESDNDVFKLELLDKNAAREMVFI